MPRISTGVSLFADAPDKQWRLTSPLQEISGLAVTPDGRVMGHNDESAVIFEIDVETGEIVKRFTVGQPTARDDFEGLAITADGDFYLTTSTGRVFASAKARRARRCRTRPSTPGFVTFARSRALPCWRPNKASFSPARNCTRRVCVTPWRSTVVHARAADSAGAEWLTLPKARLAEAVGARNFHPSVGRRSMSAADASSCSRRGRTVWSNLSSTGDVLAARELGSRHRQAEGSAILPDGALLIADEGENAVRAVLSRYPRRS